MAHLNFSLLIELQVGFNDQEITTLFKLFDIDHRNYLDIEEFLTVLRGLQPSYRRMLIRQAYRLLDPTHVGYIAPSDVIERFDPTQHPDVKHGLKKAQEVFREFLRAFHVGGEIECVITRNEFMNYYLNVSASIPVDGMEKERGETRNNTRERSMDEEDRASDNMMINYPKGDRFFEELICGTWHLPVDDRERERERDREYNRYDRREGERNSERGREYYDDEEDRGRSRGSNKNYRNNNRRSNSPRQNNGSRYNNNDRHHKENTNGNNYDYRSGENDYSNEYVGQDRRSISPSRRWQYGRNNGPQGEEFKSTEGEFNDGYRMNNYTYRNKFSDTFPEERDSDNGNFNYQSYRQRHRSPSPSYGSRGGRGFGGEFDRSNNYDDNNNRRNW